MIRSRTHDSLILLFNILGTVGSLLNCPEGRLCVILLLGVYLILACRLILEFRFPLLFLSLLKLLPHVKVSIVFVLLKHIQLLGFLYQLHLLFYLLFSQLLLLILLILKLFLLSLLDKILQHAFLTKYVSLVAHHWIHNLMSTNCTHVKWFLWILSDPLFYCAIESFEHFPLAICKHIGARIVFGMFTHL